MPHAVHDGATGRAGEPDVAIDLGGWMLVRFRCAHAESRVGRIRWVALQRQGSNESWHATRCALFASRSRGEPVDATTP